MPFFAVAMPMMAYNRVRFGSFFDFGATYNITGADMTNRGFEIVALLAAKHNGESGGIFLIAEVTLAGLGIAINAFDLLADDRYGALANAFPSIYYSVKSWLMVFF